MGKAKKKGIAYEFVHVNKHGVVIDENIIEQRIREELKSLSLLASQKDKVENLFERFQKYEEQMYGKIIKRVKYPFGYDFTREQIEKLTEIFNLYISEMPFKLSVKQVETIFTTHEYIGYMRVKNRPLAFMFDELSTKGMVCNNWQEVIEKNGLFASKSGKKLKAKDLSVALSRYKSDEWNRSFTKSPMKEPYKSIREAISLL